MPSKTLNIIVNRTAEHGNWIAKVKKHGGEVTVVFRQRKENADISTRFLDAIHGYKAADQLSRKYLAAMNLNYQNLPREPNTTYLKRTKTRPTNEQIDQKFKAASDKQEKKESVTFPTVLAPFMSFTDEFKSIKVTINDEYKEQLKEQKRQTFLDYLFDAVKSSTGQPLSDNEQKYYRSVLMPATDLVCGFFNKEQWTDDDLRIANGTLNFFLKKAAFVEEDEEFIAALLKSLDNESTKLNLTAQNRLG